MHAQIIVLCCSAKHNNTTSSAARAQLCIFPIKTQQLSCVYACRTPLVDKTTIAYSNIRHKLPAAVAFVCVCCACVCEYLHKIYVLGNCGRSERSCVDRTWTITPKNRSMTVSQHITDVSAAHYVSFARSIGWSHHYNGPPDPPMRRQKVVSHQPTRRIKPSMHLICHTHSHTPDQRSNKTRILAPPDWEPPSRWAQWPLRPHCSIVSDTSTFSGL